MFLIFSSNYKANASESELLENLNLMFTRYEQLTYDFRAWKDMFSIKSLSL